MNPSLPPVDVDVLNEIQRLNVRRLVHFTPSRNLYNILLDRQLRSTADLTRDTQAVYAPTDQSRMDGEPDKICCSIEFPNVYYLRQARLRPEGVNYPDWVVLKLAPTLAARAGTLFCHRNAAGGAGAYLQPGIEGLRACYAPRVLGARGVWYVRGSGHLCSAPTDVQAEALVPGPVPLALISGVALPTVEHVRLERGRLTQLGVKPDLVNWYVAPGLFEIPSILSAIQRSNTIQETAWAKTLETQEGAG